MPGLFGCCQWNGFDSNKQVRKMASRLLHYDFYNVEIAASSQADYGIIKFVNNKQSGVYADSETGITIAVDTSLLIIDELKGGANGGRLQPMERLIDLYKSFGPGMVDRIKGHFNIAILDPDKESLIIFNGRFGFRHLYYYQDDDMFLFSPETKALMSYEKFDRALDFQGVSDYFLYSYQFGNRTFFKKVKLLPPASWLVVGKGRKVELQSYWSPRYTSQRNIDDMPECVETGYNLFCESVTNCINDESDALIPLSGGLDSRFIVSVAKNICENIQTVTFGVPGCLDEQIAKKVCKTLGIKKHRMLKLNTDWLWQYADQLVELGECSFGSLGLTTSHAFFDEIGSSSICFLNGIFGGHLTFGSGYFTHKDLENNYSPDEQFRRLLAGFNGHRYESILHPCAAPMLNDIIDSYARLSLEEEWERSGVVSDSYALRQDYIFCYNRIRRCMNAIDQNRFFYNDQIPFASYKLYDFYLSLSPELMLDHRLYKEIYKRKMPELASLPWQNTGVDLFHNPTRWHLLKKRFKQYITWYATRLSNGTINIHDRDSNENFDISFRNSRELREWMKSILLSERLRNRGFFDSEGIKSLVEKELKGYGYFYDLSKIVMFELWARKFLDE